jgi:subtilisin family serine protease
MKETSKTAYRLHPKLRIFRNGSAGVNYCRSKNSTLVTQKKGNELKKNVSIDTEEIDFSAAQASIHTLSLEMSVDNQGLSKDRLKKREKKFEMEVADEAFVNVFINVAPNRMKKKGGSIEETAEKLAAYCQRKLVGAQSQGVQGAVIRRHNIVAATVPISYLDDLENNLDVAFIQPADPLKLDLPASFPGKKPTSRRIKQKNIHHQGEGVIIGIIDVGGFDFAHSDFLDASGKTRFINIWDQKSDYRKPPKSFDYGTEFRKKDHLDPAIEAKVLTATLLEPQSQSTESSHGTHVASIAAGNNGVCPKAEIAAVLIDVPQPEDEREGRQFTFSDSSRIIHAVEYLLGIAREKNKPISINISLGTNGGGHDGSSGVTRWLDMALTEPGRSICIAVGNSGQEKSLNDQDFGWRSGRIHTSGKIVSKGLDKELDWVVVGNGVADVSENELEVWYSAQDRFSVEVLPPGESRWLKALPQEFIENKRLRDGTTVSIYNELYNPTNGINSISIYLSPNLEPGNIRGIRSGIWRVRLVGEEIRNGDFHCWIERDDPQEVGRAEGQRLLRFPSFFSEKTNVDSHSISSLACGSSTIAVSNYDHLTNKINISSSQGPTRDGRFKPDIAAPGSNIVAAKGFSNDAEKWVSKTGTSMASPYVTGVIGLMLNANPDLNSMQCLGILQRTARPMPGLSYEWSNDAGFGRVDPEEAVKEASSFTKRTERG